MSTRRIESTLRLYLKPLCTCCKSHRVHGRIPNKYPQSILTANDLHHKAFILSILLAALHIPLAILLHILLVVPLALLHILLVAPLALLHILQVAPLALHNFLPRVPFLQNGETFPQSGGSSLPRCGVKTSCLNDEMAQNDGLALSGVMTSCWNDEISHCDGISRYGEIVNGDFSPRGDFLISCLSDETFRCDEILRYGEIVYGDFSQSDDSSQSGDHHDEQP